MARHSSTVSSIDAADSNMDMGRFRLSAAAFQTVVLSAAFLLLCLMCLMLGWRYVNPTDGLTIVGVDYLANGIRVAPWEPTQSFWQDGDLVVAVENVSLVTWAERAWSAPLPPIEQGNSLTYTVLRDGVTQTLEVPFVQYDLRKLGYGSFWSALKYLLPLVMALIVLAMRPMNKSAALFVLNSVCLMGSVYTYIASPDIGDLVSNDAYTLKRLLSHLFVLVYFGAIAHFFVIFPDEKNPFRWKGWVPLFYIFPFLLYAFGFLTSYLSRDSMLSWLGEWATGINLGFIFYSIVVIVIAIRKYRRVLSLDERRRTRMVLLSGGLVMVYLAVLIYIPLLTIGEKLVSDEITGWLPAVFIPVSFGVAIVRHQLFEIEVIISRTLVYAIVTAMVIGLYVILVGFITQLLPNLTEQTGAILATAVVAILFQPLREWAQRGVSRLLFGQRDDPFEVLNRLGKRLEMAIEPGSILPAIVSTVATALQVSYVAIHLDEAYSTQPAYAYGEPNGEIENIPLVHQGQTVGNLFVAQRTPGDPFSVNDWKVLHTIAQQAGTAVYAVRLTSQLQRSRQRLITTREEERRRLRRDLHDGLGPTLASHVLKIGAARTLIEKNPHQADELLNQLEVDVEQTLADIRRLVYALRPPALDQLGLAGAIRQLASLYPAQGASQTAVEIDIDIQPLPPLSAATEVAAYRIAQAALDNVIKHARATRCQIHIGIEDTLLTLAISDNGRGMPTDQPFGIGLSSIRERVEELGGLCHIGVSPLNQRGVHIDVRLPIKFGEFNVSE